MDIIIAKSYLVRSESWTCEYNITLQCVKL